MKEASVDDRPKGREAQCPVCWRIFGGDTAAERHKSYAKPVTGGCKSPADVGLQARERRGMTVWCAAWSTGREMALPRGAVASQAVA